jgi:RecJ-like exonuclease
MRVSFEEIIATFIDGRRNLIRHRQDAAGLCASSPMEPSAIDPT